MCQGVHFRVTYLPDVATDVEIILSLPHSVIKMHAYWGYVSIAANLVILLGFYNLATFKLRSYQDWYQLVTVCTHGSFILSSAASLGGQATGVMIEYLTQSHYPDTKLIRRLHILVMPSVRVATSINHWLT